MKLFDKLRTFFKNFRQPNTEEQSASAKEASPYTEDEDFIRNSKAAMLAKTTPATHIILFTILGIIVILLIWAYFATIEQVAVGTGKVIPSSQVKVIQSLDGGIVSEILVREGQIVKKDQILIRLDDTRYKADYEAAHARYIVLEGSIARLTAEAQEQETIDFPEEVRAHPKVIALETKLFETRKLANKEEIKSLQENYENAKRETAMHSQLLAKGYTSKLEHLRSQQRQTDIKLRMIGKENEFREQVKEDLTKYEGELKSLTEQLRTVRDKMIRTTIVSPVYGIVKKINVVTVGGVISPGMEIMQIVPLTDTLLIQARIKPEDIAFIHVGQKATVKITAYDYSIYGSLPGTVEYISADTVTEERAPGTSASANESMQAYYVVNVRVKRNYLGSEHYKLYIMPGMVATVHIQTGKKTILQYLLKPIIKAKEEALRER